MTDRVDPRSCYSVEVDGIPALAEITHYEPEEPAVIDCHPDRAHPGSAGILDYVLRDRRGYRAEWLDDRGDDADIEAQIRAQIERNKGSY